MISSLRHLELELAMDGTGGQEDVDALLRRVLQGFPAAIDVGVVAAGEAADGRARESRAAMARTASKSPGEAIGKPASMMSTPRSRSARAISSFSARFMLAPGDCSPSRSVVSKMTTRFGSLDVDMAWTPAKQKGPGLEGPEAGIDSLKADGGRDL